MTISSLPVTDLYIGFYKASAGVTSGALIDYPSLYGLPSSGSSNTEWVNASEYLLSYSLEFGKEHFLDRAEPATATIMLNARDGFFFNGTVNGQGVTLQRNLPIAITETVSGTQHPVYMGYIQQVHENPADQVNDVIEVDASDFSGILAITEATNPSLYGEYANSTNAQNWYRLGIPQTVSILAAFNYVPSWIAGVTVASNQVLYVVSGANSFTVSEIVTTSGLSAVAPSTNGLCFSGMTVNQVVGQYIVATLAAGSTPGTHVSSQGTGTMYNVVIYDQIATADGAYEGLVSWPNQGALIYDTDSCVDLGAGGYGNQSGYLAFPISTAAGAECWFLGLNAVGQTIIGMGDVATSVRLDMTASGTLVLVTNAGSPVNHFGSSVSITDGNWHHVGVFIIASQVWIYCDGNFTLTSYTPSGAVFSEDPIIHKMLVGNGDGGELLGAYIDEVIFSSAGVAETEIEERYVVGNLCQQPKYSGDRIAELLFIAGFGAVKSSSLGLDTPLNFFLIGETYGTLTDYNTVAGTAGTQQVEPFYWDTPITGSMILDLIGQVTSTDYGVFLQLQNGAYAFFTQSWFGTWSYTENPRTQLPTSSSWIPNSSSWSGASTLSDDDSGIAYVTDSLDIISDGSDLYTLVAVDPQAGQRQVLEVSPSSTLTWGSQTLEVSSNLPTSLEQARSLGWYLGTLFQPSLLRRVNAVTTGTEQGNGANNVALLEMFIWTVVFFKRTPPNASTSGGDPGQIDYAMAIESLRIDFEADPGYIHWTFGLSPYEVN